MVLASTEYNYYTKAGQTYQSPYLILIPVLVVLVIIITGCIIQGHLKSQKIAVEKDKLKKKTALKTTELEQKKEENLNNKKKKSKISYKVKVDI